MNGLIPFEEKIDQTTETISPTPSLAQKQQQLLTIKKNDKVTIATILLSLLKQTEAGHKFISSELLVNR